MENEYLSNVGSGKRVMDFIYKYRYELLTGGVFLIGGGVIAHDVMKHNYDLDVVTKPVTIRLHK